MFAPEISAHGRSFSPSYHDPKAFTKCSINSSIFYCSRIKSTVATVIYFYISHKKMESKRQVKFISIFMRSQAANLRQLYQNGRLLTTTTHSADIRMCRHRPQICTENVSHWSISKFLQCTLNTELFTLYILFVAKFTWCGKWQKCSLLFIYCWWFTWIEIVCQKKTKSKTEKV